VSVVVWNYSLDLCVLFWNVHNLKVVDSRDQALGKSWPLFRSSNLVCWVCLGFGILLSLLVLSHRRILVKIGY
jgi:hypothetical protein